MKERLIELIKSSSQYVCEDAYLVERIADHLLANGVIVLPCAVGDTVYFICFDEICEATVVRIELNYYTNPKEWIVIEYYSKAIGIHEHKSRVDLMFGRNTFLTKEEAEKELERRNNEKV